MTRWTHAAVVAFLTLAGCSAPTETRIQYVMVQPEAGEDATALDASPWDVANVDASPDMDTPDGVLDSSPDVDSSSCDALPDVGHDASSDMVIESSASDVAIESDSSADAPVETDAKTDADAGPGVLCPCEYAYQCKCLSSSSQTYPFEVTGEIIYGQGTQYVIATCPPGETRSDGLNNCWPTGDVKTLQPGWEDGANGWRCAGWFEPQCTGCPVPHGTLTTRTRCNRDWCNEWAACK
jgi:hypothetical protein